MTILDNLRQAAQEFFGFTKPKEDIPFRLESEELDENSPPLSYEEPEPYVSPGTAMAEANLNSETYNEFYPHKDTSFIARGTTVHGRIATNGHVEVLGRVNGNIDAGGDVAVQGNVSGNIKGEHIGLYTCLIRGNLNATSGVVIDAESIVLGDVETQNVVINGKVKGNIDVDQLVVFQGNSYILGDIKAQALSIETGAVINGMVTTMVDHDLDGPFENLY